MPTANLNLTLPTEGGSKGSWGTELNTALTAIDAVLKDATTSVHGFISTTDKSKLDNIEASAKDDQTNAEIKTAYEANANTEVLTTALLNRLNSSENNSKDDQTGAEIKIAYEAENDTNAFTDAFQTKLNSCETDSKDDQTASEIKTLYESLSETRATGVTAGTYGTSTDTPQFIVNANGRVTSATNVPIDNVNIAEGVAISLSIALG